MTVGEILGILAYSIVTNFLESLLVLSVIILISLLLPRKLFLDTFVIRGTAFAIVILGWMMYFSHQIADVYKIPNSFPYWTALAFGTTILFSTISGKIKTLGKILQAIAERATVFLYLWMPVSFVCLVVVIFRNLF